MFFQYKLYYKICSNIWYKVKVKLDVLLGKRIQGVFLSIFDYKRFNTNKTINIRRVDSAKTFNLNLPIHCNEEFPERFHINFYKAYPDVYFASVPNCKVALIDSRIGVITKDNMLIEDLSPNLSSNKEHPFLFFQLPKSKFLLKGNTLVLASYDWKENYYHWMFHIIGRLSVLKALEIDFDEFDHIVVNKPIKKFQEQSLLDFNLPKEKLVFIENDDLIKIENAFLPSYLYFHPMVPHFLRRHYLKSVKAHENASKKIYISRRNSPIRKLIEEEDVVDLLVKEFGYQEVFLEDYSLKEQSQIMHQADFVIAPHGAGLPNIIYCKKHTKVLEILPYSWTNVVYWIYAEYQELEYSVFLAGDKNANPDGYLDYNLNLEKFKSFIIQSGF